MDDVNIVSISATAYKHHIDNSTASAYCAIVYKMPSKTDCEFVSAIDQRVEICKMMRSIGSFTMSDTPCELFSDKIIGQQEELEDQICNILGPEAVSQVKDKISNVQANCGKGFNQNHSSNIWVVSEELAIKAIVNHSQLCKHHADNSLSKQLYTNNRMLRYRRINIVSFTDILLVKTTPSTHVNKYAQL